jgi:hypothetical protein
MATASATSRLQRDSVREIVLDSLAGEPARARAASDLAQATWLRVCRQDIEFTDIAPGRVAIAITVTNVGSDRSHPTGAVIQAAPLGAFVTWRPLAVLRVPSLKPGESGVMRTQVERVIPKPLGPPDRLPPARLLTALDFDAEESGAAAASALAGQPPQLPLSPFDLLTGPSTYWAGNLNVFVGGQAVERHMAKALRIFPGRTNAAMFVVGGRDSYRFDLFGLGSDWRAQIFNPMRALSMSRGVSDGATIPFGTWTSLRGQAMLLLVLQPPANGRAANVEVRVTQASTRKTAVVEFSFDPQASGPGCYVVE